MRAKSLPQGVWLTRQRISEIFAENGQESTLSYLCSGQKEFSQYVDALVHAKILEAKTGKEVAIMQSRREISTRDIADMSDWLALEGQDDRVAYEADRLLHARRLGNVRAESLELVESVHDSVSRVLSHSHFVESDGKILIPTVIATDSDIEYRRIYFRNSVQGRRKKSWFSWLFSPVPERT